MSFKFVNKIFKINEISQIHKFQNPQVIKEILKTFHFHIQRKF